MVAIKRVSSSMSGGKGSPMIAKRIATQGLTDLLASDDRQTDANPPDGTFSQKEPIAARRGNASKIRMNPRAEMAGLCHAG